MKHMKGKFFAALLGCLLAALVLLPARAWAMWEITVVNKTDATVSLALARTGEEDDDFDCSKGWWNVEPGKKRTITPGFFGSGNAYWYAQSMGGKRVWGGNGPAFWVHPNKFEANPHKPLKGGKKVYFNSLTDEIYHDTATLTVDLFKYTATLTFTAK